MNLNQSSCIHRVHNISHLVGWCQGSWTQCETMCDLLCALYLMRNWRPQGIHNAPRVGFVILFRREPNATFLAQTGATGRPVLIPGCSDNYCVQWSMYVLWVWFSCRCGVHVLGEGDGVISHRFAWVWTKLQSFKQPASQSACFSSPVCRYADFSCACCVEVVLLGLPLSFLWGVCGDIFACNLLAVCWGTEVAAAVYGMVGSRVGVTSRCRQRWSSSTVVSDFLGVATLMETKLSTTATDGLLSLIWLTLSSLFIN